MFALFFKFFQTISGLLRYLLGSAGVRTITASVLGSCLRFFRRSRGVDPTGLARMAAGGSGICRGGHQPIILHNKYFFFLMSHTRTVLHHLSKSPKTCGSGSGTLEKRISSDFEENDFKRGSYSHNFGKGKIFDALNKGSVC
jgi:hypothetical protein